MAKILLHIMFTKMRVSMCARNLWVIAFFLLNACSTLSVDEPRNSRESSSASQAELNNASSAEQPTSLNVIITSDEHKTISPVNEAVVNEAIVNANAVKIPKNSDSQDVNAENRLSKNNKNNAVETKSSKKTLRSGEGKAKQEAITVSNQNKGLITKSNSVDRDSDTRFKDLALESLPMQIGLNWLLSRDAESEKRCALFYGQDMMKDGQGGTPVRLIVTGSTILFKTKSNIDLSYAKTGITIDQQTQIPIERLFDSRSILYEERYGSIVGSMKSAQRLVLTLGFWPSWPSTQTYTLNFDISDFSLAFNALKSCVSLEKQLH